MDPRVLESMQAALLAVQGARGHFVEVLNVLGLPGLQYYPRLFGWCGELTAIEHELYTQHNAVLAHMAREQAAQQQAAVPGPVAPAAPAADVVAEEGQP